MDNLEQKQGSEVFVCSVGGSPKPVALSILVHKPQRVLFIVSSESREQVEFVRQLAGNPNFVDMDIIQVDDPQDLRSCMYDIRNGLLEYERKSGLEDIYYVADITGGTKPMCSGLTLAMMDFDSRFSYVGGERRSKDGLGIVLDGSEKVLGMDNPWQAMAMSEARDLVSAFNHRHLGTAVRLSRQLSQQVSSEKNFYAGLDDIVNAYACWDAFDYKGAWAKLNSGISKLVPYDSRRYPELKTLLARFKADRLVLEAVMNDCVALRAFPGKPLPQGAGKMFLLDLIANAVRRGVLGRYDDAVARLYSVVEKAVKTELAFLGINNSSIKVDQLASIPQGLRAKLERQPDDGVIRTGLFQSYELLAALDPLNPLALAYREHEKHLRHIMDVRNQSLLAHGFTPVKESTYADLLKAALAFLQTDRKDLFDFPKLELSSFLMS